MEKEKDQICFALKLRREQTDAERLLWSQLRRKQLEGLKFRRQQPIGRYIADFVCFEGKLIVEVDGSQHGEIAERDDERTSWLGSQGFKVLRFWNHDLLENIEGVWELIREALK